MLDETGRNGNNGKGAERIPAAGDGEEWCILVRDYVPKGDPGLRSGTAIANLESGACARFLCFHLDPDRRFEPDRIRPGKLTVRATSPELFSRREIE
jgi:hypothetical protein